MAGQPGFFDLSDWYEALSAAGDPDHLVLGEQQLVLLGLGQHMKRLR
ncbi:hypothetical protein [Novosphingobium sp. M1R2S20]|uniref:SAM-dependent methyltransferase n=1 Tax=Novosphingobium rhizovicinum TaxID=3228928 RepID=A0ABV3RCL3_9SPHN